MRISKEKAADNRVKVLRAARDLFSAHGFDGVGVADVMSAAGLTHGGFYNHFQSKEHLHACACAFAFEGTIRRVEKIVARIQADGNRAALAEFIDVYLSSAACDAPAVRCALAAFDVDVARAGPLAQEAYAKGVESFFKALAPIFGDGPHAHAQAVALMSALVGALHLGRSLRAGDPALAEQVLMAARESIKATFAGAFPLRAVDCNAGA